jgi:glycosyltransferase involved in cell wall biosynthesis
MISGQTTAWIISDIPVNENKQPHWRMYAYADALKSCGIRCVNFFGNDARLVSDHGYANAKVGQIDELLEKCIPEFVIIYTWHKNYPYLEKFVDRKIPIINRADSDGRVSLRYHPWDTLRYKLSEQRSLINKIRAFRYWFYRYLREGKDQIKELITNVEKSAVVALGSPGCVDEFKSFLGKVGRDDLQYKIQFLPYPTDEIFFTSPVLTKTKSIIVIHNWLSPTGINKNPHLIPKVFDLVFRKRQDYQLHILGSGTNQLFGNWAAGKKNVKLSEHTSSGVVADLMGSTSILFTASQMEGSPIVANEMLGCGGTLVGGPLPSLKGLVGHSEYGCVAKNWKPKSLANALLFEMEQWSNGKRASEAIASHWRPILGGNSIGRKILEMINDSN